MALGIVLVLLPLMIRSDADLLRETMATYDDDQDYFKNPFAAKPHHRRAMY